MKHPNLFMDQLRPKFNAIEGTDFGPGQEGGVIRQIRFTIADYKKLLKKFLTEYIVVPEAGPPWPGPLEFTASLWEDAAHTGTNQHQETKTTNPPYNKYQLGGGVGISAATGNTSDVDDFFDPLNPIEGGACPLLHPEDPEDPERQPAHLTEIANGTIGIGFRLDEPAITQTKWAEATHVWLPFEILVGAEHTFVYVCDPSSEVSGVVTGPPIDRNFLGIDYAGGGGGFDPAPTDEIPIGDGTTSVFLWTPTAQRFTLDALNTRVGLDD